MKPIEGFQDYFITDDGRIFSAKYKNGLRELKLRKDDFLPAAEYLRRAGLGHYREANTKIGRHSSPWGDWDSTLVAEP